MSTVHGGSTLAEKHLRAVAAIMREVGATYVKSGDLEIRLGPSPAPAPVPVAEDKPEPLPVCACGHDLTVEHGAVGCLHGCSLERCGDAPERTPDA